MRPAPRFILALAFVSFLTITLSGFHLHADVGGHDVAESHAHDLHQVIDHDLDHDSEHVDITVSETARGFAQVDSAAPVDMTPEIAAPSVVDVRWSKVTHDIVPRRYSRLRPPLRAPPISV